VKSTHLWNRIVGVVYPALALLLVDGKSSEGGRLAVNLWNIALGKKNALKTSI
jgi:hypothetical protein